MKFNHLDIPYQWKEYYTKYPHGFTVWEAVCQWAEQVNVFIDELNFTNSQIEHLFEKVLPESVSLVLNQWVADGTLADFVNIDILDRKANVADVNMRGANVKEFGAIGDGLTNDSQAFQNALDANDIVYVPFGTYIVENITVSNFDRKVIQGADGAILKPTKRFATNNVPNRMFTIENGNEFYFKGFEVTSDRSNPLTPGESFFGESLLHFNLVESVYIDSSYFHNIHFDEWPQYSPRTPSNINGGILTIKNSDLYFTNNKVVNITGDEWIYHNLGETFEDGYALYKNNIFGDVYLKNGSMISIFGGDVAFIGNEVRNFEYAGSAFNFFSNNVLVHDNDFINIDAKEVIDTSESGKYKATNVTVFNNYFDCPMSKYAVLTDAVNVNIYGNYIRAWGALLTRAIANTTTHRLYPYGKNNAYETIEINNNRIIKTINNPLRFDYEDRESAVTVIMGGATNDQYVVLDTVNITGNHFTSEGTKNSAPINLNCLASDVVIKDNYLGYIGFRATSEGYTTFINKTTYGITGVPQKVKILNNVFDNASGFDFDAIRALVGVTTIPTPPGGEKIMGDIYWLGNSALLPELLRPMNYYDQANVIQEGNMRFNFE